MASRRGPDNTVRVAISGDDTPTPWANIFYAQLVTSSTPSQADLDAWLTSFQAAYKTNFAPQIASQANFGLARAVLFVPGGSELISQIAMTGAGTGGSGGAYPASTGVLISWGSNVYWRGGKPRTYLPGFPAGNETTTFEITTGFQTSTTAAAVAFRTAINALTSGAITGTTLGFVSFRSGNADRVPPVFYSFTGAKVHRRMATQRRRLGAWLP